MDPQGGVGSDDEGADIEGGALGGGYPALLHAHQGLDPLQGQILGKLGDAQPLAGLVQPLYVVHGTEQPHAALRVPVGLHALKDLLGIVEDHAGGLQGQSGIGLDPGAVPAFARVVVHQKHVVGKHLAKHQLGRVGQGLEGGCLVDLDLFHQWVTPWS